MARNSPSSRQKVDKARLPRGFRNLHPEPHESVTVFAPDGKVQTNSRQDNHSPIRGGHEDSAW